MGVAELPDGSACRQYGLQEVCIQLEILASWGFAMRIRLGFLWWLLTTLGVWSMSASLPDGRYFYVATPGIRNYLEYGGDALLVFAIDNDYRFVRCMPTAGLNREGKPENVKGVCASAHTGLLHIANLSTLTCIDFTSAAVLWEKAYPVGCDRMSIAPDGFYLYLSSFEKDHWNVVSAKDGTFLAKITPELRSPNTIFGRNGMNTYLAGLRFPLLTVADTSMYQAMRKVGPFRHNICSLFSTVPKRVFMSISTKC